MKGQVRILHIEGLRRGLADAAAKMPDSFVKALHEAGYMIEVPAARKATELFEHPTGNLPASIHTEVMRTELTARVGTNLEYAALREFGGIVEGAWGKAVAVHAGRPYLIPAFKEAQPKIQKLFKELLENMVSNVVTKTRAS